MRRAWPLVLALLAGACASLEYGAPPLTDRLDRLTAGVSTRADVLLALGEPRGHGAMLPAPELPRHDVLLYEHMTMDGMTIRLRMLLVLLRDGLYEGHLSFEDRGERR